MAFASMCNPIITEGLTKQEQVRQVQLQQAADRKRQADLEKQIESSMEVDTQAKRKLREERAKELDEQRAAEAALRESSRADPAEPDKRAKFGPTAVPEEPADQLPGASDEPPAADDPPLVR